MGVESARIRAGRELVPATTAWRACYLGNTHAPMLRFRALLDEEAPRVELALIQ